MPALYDLAFGYRDYQEEVDFLLHQHELCSSERRRQKQKQQQQQQSSVDAKPIRVLELAAGPARHALTALANTSTRTKVQSAIAIDLSPEMASYAQELALELLPANPTALDYRIQDMRTFSLQKDEQVDTAWILLGSLQHLTENQDIIQCFHSVRQALCDDGTLIIELPHPRETFSMVKCTRNGWEVPLEDEDGKQSGELTIIWGEDDDLFDPIRQVRQFTIAMELNGVPSTNNNNNDDNEKEKEMQNVREIVPMRLFTAQEIDALAQCAGMKVVHMYGALEEGVAVDDDEMAFRLVCVLQKR